MTPDTRAKIPIASVSRLGSEGRPERGIRLHARAATKVDAIGHRGEHRVEASADSRGLARQIDDQARAAGPRALARENRRWDLCQAFQAHEFAEAGQHSVADRLRRL